MGLMGDKETGRQGDKMRGDRIEGIEEIDGIDGIEEIDGIDWRGDKETGRQGED